jgi:hypothetical protein
MRGWLAACVVACTMGSGLAAAAATGVWTPAPIGPEWFVETYVQQGRFRQAHALVDEFEPELGPAPQLGADASRARDSAATAATARGESYRRIRSAVIRARVRLLLAERDWSALRGAAAAERCRSDEPVVCTFAQGYAAARLAWPGAKADLIAEAGICARTLEQLGHDAVSITELYRVLVRAAIAAAQEESPEGELLLAHAASLERRLIDTGQIDTPLQPASEIAGDLWMQLYRDDAARRAYRAALEAWPRRAGSLIGVARASVRLGDDAGAKEAYRALVDIWQAADRTRPELAEARRALGF